MKKNSEEYMQIFIASFLKKLQAAGGDFVFWHTPNGGVRNKAEAGKLKLMGVLRGVHDLIIVHKNGIEFIELKEAGGGQSKEQIELSSALKKYGFKTYVVYMDSVQDGINKLSKILIDANIGGIDQNGISKSSSSVLASLI